MSSKLDQPHESPSGQFPADVVKRDGDRLIVRRGADISATCFCCGQTTVSRITTHLRRKKSNVFGRGVHSTSSIMLFLDLLQLVVFFLLVLADIPASRKRPLTYGLCASHFRKRRLMLIGSPLALVIGIALWVYEFRNLNAPVYIGLPAAILGTGLLAASGFLYFWSPGPTLVAEDPHLLWIKGYRPDPTSEKS
jgi:hypothetical protein